MEREKSWVAHGTRDFERCFDAAKWSLTADKSPLVAAKSSLTADKSPLVAAQSSLTADKSPMVVAKSSLAADKSSPAAAKSALADEKALWQLPKTPWPLPKAYLPPAARLSGVFPCIVSLSLSLFFSISHLTTEYPLSLNCRGVYFPLCLPPCKQKMPRPQAPHKSKSKSLAPYKHRGGAGR